MVLVVVAPGQQLLVIARCHYRAPMLQPIGAPRVTTTLTTSSRTDKRRASGRTDERWRDLGSSVVASPSPDLGRDPSLSSSCSSMSSSGCASCSPLPSLRSSPPVPPRTHLSLCPPSPALIWLLRISLRSSPLAPSSTVHDRRVESSPSTTTI